MLKNLILIINFLFFYTNATAKPTHIIVKSQPNRFEILNNEIYASTCEIKSIYLPWGENIIEVGEGLRLKGYKLNQKIKRDDSTSYFDRNIETGFTFYLTKDDSMGTAVLYYRQFQLDFEELTSRSDDGSEVKIHMTKSRILKNSSLRLKFFDGFTSEESFIWDINLLPYCKRMVD